MLVFKKLTRYILCYRHLESDSTASYHNINTKHIGYDSNISNYSSWSYYIYNNTIYTFNKKRIYVETRFKDYQIEQVFELNIKNRYHKHITYSNRTVEFNFEDNDGRIIMTFTDKTYIISYHYKLINKKYKLLSIRICLGYRTEIYPTAIIYQNHIMNGTIYEIKLYRNMIKIKSLRYNQILFKKM